MRDAAPRKPEKRARLEQLDLSPRNALIDARASRYRGAGGVDEHHLMLRPRQGADVEQQLRWLAEAYREILAVLGLNAGSALCRRFFCNDIRNQSAALAACALSRRDAPGAPCAVSWIEQPPAPPASVSLWAYHARLPEGDLDKTLEDSTLAWRHGGLTHCWTNNLTCPQTVESGVQTRGVLERYERLLQGRGMSLASNVARTWLFVHDIDNNYADMVAARRECFRERGLTPETHFIASTGIEGRGVEPSALVTLDAYAIGGLRPEQVAYLAAPEYLCPTHVYGVTFERGVTIGYRDREHVFISGTASIDRRGELLYPGDINRQLDRTLLNIEALLKQAHAGFRDISQMLAYVRDPADLEFVERRVRERCGAVPLLVVTAPVCRPGWLVEIECQAVTVSDNQDLPPF